MVVDGRRIAEGLEQKLHEKISSKGISLVVFVFEGNLPAHTFVQLKKKVGERLGVRVQVESLLSKEETTDSLCQRIVSTRNAYTGVIVQLPLPPHIDSAVVRNAISLEQDVDALSDAAYVAFEKGEGVLPPVVGAIKHIANDAGVLFTGKKVLVVGQGRLVGKPSALWFEQQGAQVTSVTLETNRAEFFKKADCIVLGAGSPGLLTPFDIKEGVIIFDAGTSEESGRLVGDADPKCAEKAAVFTPVPGGIGPVTVVTIFENLLYLSQ